MSIFDRVALENTHYKRHDPFERPFLSMYQDFKPTGANQGGRHFFQEQYSLSLTVETTFWANSAQLDGFREQSMKVLAKHLFRDVHMNLDQLLMHVMDGSNEAAIECVSRIRKAITP